MLKSIKTNTIAVANQGGAMEADTISKHGASPKSQMSRGNFLEKRLGVLLLIMGIFIYGCNKEDEFDNVTPNVSKVEIADFKNWLNSQEITNGFIEKQKLNWSNVEIKLMRDGKTQHVLFKIYKDKNSLGNDSIRELQIAYVNNSFIGGVKVFSFYNKENAHAKYYNLSGQILEEGEYYAPKQLYSLQNRYIVEGRKVRLKSGNESNDPCDGTQMYTNSATPLKINGAPNPAAYNCHTYAWGALSSNDPCYNPTYPQWNNCPNPSALGYSQISTPQAGDRCISYGYDPNWGNNAPIHSAIVKEVKNGKVTKVEAKCGEQGIYIYNPDCDAFASYKTNDIKCYRK
jgi:hypothetical protein